MKPRLVGQALRVTMPYEGRERTLYVVVVRTLYLASVRGLDHRCKALCEVRILPWLGIRKARSVVVEQDELETMLKCKLAEPIRLPCHKCKGVMTFQQGHVVSVRHGHSSLQPFFACDACENCVVV